MKVAEIAAFFVLTMPKNHVRLGLHGLKPNQSLPSDPKVPLAVPTNRLGCNIRPTEAHLSDELRQKFIDEKNHFFGKFDEMGVRCVLDIIRSDKVFLFITTNEFESRR